MKRIILITFFWSIALVGWGQIKLPQVRALEGQGWSVQHSVMSWDSLSIYFSAKAPGNDSYDLYVLRAEGWRWGKPQRIDALSTEADETWPSISSDEQMLFYVVSLPTITGSQVWRAWNREGKWEEAAPLIISSAEDSQPQILEDNRTLIFTRREQTKKYDGAWHTFSAGMMDDHNWTLPSPIETLPTAHAILVANGTIVMKKNGRPLQNGKVMVYDAMREQLLQTAHVHPMTGHYNKADTTDWH